jgi:hypothetical protein
MNTRFVTRSAPARRVGDEHRLDHPPVVGTQPELARAVLRHLLGVDGERAHLGRVGDARAQVLGEIGHRLDLPHAPRVHPAEDLVAAIGLHAERAREGARLGVGEIAEVLLHCFSVTRRSAGGQLSRASLPGERALRR